ncbi:hypothetical protein CEP54_001733 [Fusarium duplospermum]|uniref:Uncharacterized protein n=1 Tax=Fusarium duplospermum TaxID=1325734 RepID=A0A428QZI7_9HYPO|nr:hypothetical protein CEP54_001733 [Fusarium duplospermum]
MSARPYNYYSTGSVYNTVLLLVRSSAARIADGRAVLKIGRITMGWVSSVSRAYARGSEKSYRRRGIDRLGRVKKRARR